MSTRKAVSRRSAPKAETVARLREALATLSDTGVRGELMRRMNRTYGGKRDIYKTAGYPDVIQFEQYWLQYQRGDVGGRLIDIFPETTWRTPPEIVEEGHQDRPTKFMQAVQLLVKEQKLWSRLERLDRLSGIGRYGVLFFGTSDVTSDAAFRQPPPKNFRGLDSLLYLQAYTERGAQIAEWEQEPTNKRFGLPKTYKVQVGQDTPGYPAKTLLVHAERVIHVAENLTTDEVYGIPRMQRAYNRILDLDKVAASTGEGFWQLASRILAATVSDNAELPPGGKDSVLKDLEELAHDLRRVWVGDGMNLEWLGGETPKPKEAADMLFALIAIASGVPKRILFGSETGERASEQDQRQFLGRVNERQEKHAEPNILRPVLDWLIDHHILPKPVTGGYTVVWPSLFEETETEKAEANKRRADTAAALTPVGGDPLELVEIDADRNVWLVPRLAGTPATLPIPPAPVEDEEEVPDPPEGDEAPDSEDGAESEDPEAV